MIIEAIVDGQVKKVWVYDQEVPSPSEDQTSSFKRKKSWNKIIDECRAHMGDVGKDKDRCIMVIKIKSKARPGDIDQVEMQRFNSELIKKGHRQYANYKRDK